MSRIARPLAFVLVGLGVAGSAALAVFLLVAGGSAPSDAEWYAMSTVRRGLLYLAHSDVALPAAAALLFFAAVAAALAWRARTVRWPFAVIAIGSVFAIAVVWFFRDGISDVEPDSYRAHSPYVRAVTRVALGGTVYFLAVAAAATAAFFLSQPRRSGLPASAAPGTIAGGEAA